MAFVVKVIKGNPLRYRHTPAEPGRRAETLPPNHQIAALEEFLDSPEMADGEEWTSIPQSNIDIEQLIKKIINKFNAQEFRGGKRSKRKRPKRKSKKLKYFFLKRK